MVVPTVPRFAFGEKLTAGKMARLAQCVTYLMGGGTDGKPVMKLGSSVAQLIPSGEETPLVWAEALRDNRGMWSEDNPDVVTVKDDGDYVAIISTEWAANATGIRKVWFLIGEADLDGGITASTVAAELHGQIYVNLLTLSAGSTVKVMVEQNSGSPVYTGLTWWNPRFELLWWGRVGGQGPDYPDPDPTDLGELADTIAAQNALIAQLAQRLAALEGRLPTPPPPATGITRTVRINAGGGSYTDPDGNVWEADRGTAAGTISTQGIGHTFGSALDPLYTDERWGNDFTYTIGDLPVGDAQLILHFSENHAPTNAPGERVFDVTVNGVLALNDYDVYVAAGNHQYKAVTATIDTEIDSDGILTVRFVSSVNSAAVHALEVLCTGTTTPDDPGTVDPPPAPTGFWRSGATWPEGPDQYTQRITDAWGAWRGRPCDLTLTYTSRGGNDWNQLVAPSYATNNWTNKNLVVMIAQPFGPDGLGTNGAQARAVATGQFDPQWKRWGQTLKDKEALGFAPYITNLGWEFNGDWFRHAAVDPTEWVKAWKKVVDAVRSILPTAKFCWTVNAGYSQNPPSHDARQCWPGNDYVDFIGVDMYDHYPQAIGKTAVNTRETTVPGRAKYWENFAAEKGKKLILQEWGLNNSTTPEKQPYIGHDNPGYFEWVWEWLEHLWDIELLYGEAYYNDRNPGNVYSDLKETGRNPQSSLKYRELWLPAQP